MVVQIPTGLSEIDNSVNFNVYPNPSSGIIYIDSKGSVNSKVEVSIQNIHGQRVYQGDYHWQYEPLELDLSGYIDGLYFICLKEDKTVMVKKITIRK